MVGHINHIHPGLDATCGIVLMHYPLHNQRDVMGFLDMSDGVPGHAGLMRKIAIGSGCRASRHGHVAFHHIALPAGIHLSVCGKAEACIASIHCATNMIVHPALIAHQIQLVDTRPWHALSNRLVIWRTRGAEDLKDAEVLGRSSYTGATTGLKRLHRPNRRQQYGYAHGATQQLGFDLYLSDIVQNPRLKHPGLYRGAVATQARLGIRSANKIIPIPSI